MTMPTQFHKHDRVITPMDEVAFVTGQKDDKVFLHYAYALSADNAGLTLPATLLAKWPAETDRPKPVRVGMKVHAHG